MVWGYCEGGRYGSMCVYPTLDGELIMIQLIKPGSVDIYYKKLTVNLRVISNIDYLYLTL